MFGNGAQIGIEHPTTRKVMIKTREDLKWVRDAFYEVVPGTDRLIPFVPPSESAIIRIAV